MRRHIGRAALLAALLVAMNLTGAPAARAATPIVFSYSPTSGPPGTVITFTASGCGSAGGGIFNLEINPANPSGEQWSNHWESDSTTKTLVVPASLADGHYEINAQCYANGFDPTYAPCGFTVTSSGGTSGSCGAAATVPAAPTGVTGLAGPVNLTVSWSEPASDGGSPITGYQVTTWQGYALVKVSTFNETVTTQTITGPAPGQTYSFTVAAINDVGVGPESLHSKTTRYGPPMMRFGSTAAKSVAEGASGLRPVTLNVNLDQSSTAPVSVFWNTANGTAGARDYEGAYGLLTFAPGETRKVITVNVKGDTKPEPDEVFTIHLSSPSGVWLMTENKPITIVNDD